ncbi:MAG: hypothetical protein WD294_02960 [Phycisphaeraceae bacterium]
MAYPQFAARITVAALTVLIGSAAFAHENDDHSHDHAAEEYTFGDDTHAYPEPRDAGDGEAWYRGNLHTHTLWSDGDHFPEVVTQWYVENGYHFLALSDHNVMLRGERWINARTNGHIRRHDHLEPVELYKGRFGDDWVVTRENSAGDLEVRLKTLEEFRGLFERPGRFLMIESSEITQGAHVVHVNATNLAEAIQPRIGNTVEETIRLSVEAVHQQSRETGQPMLPHLNHPNFIYAVTAEDMIAVERLNFFEVYNGHRGVANLGNDIRIDLDRMWDIVLTRRLAEENGRIMYGLAVDDSHHYENSNSEVARPGRGWIVVRAAELTAENLVAGMAAGDFYATTGVTMAEIDATADHLHVAVDTASDPDAEYTIQFIGTREGYDPSHEPVMAQGAIGKIADVTDAWVFVQAVADRETGEQTLRVYDKDNDQWHEASIAMPEGATRPTGQLYLPSHASRYPFRGQMHNVRFWHSARTQAEAERDMQRKLTGTEEGLVGYWPLDETTGQRGRDLVGERHATIHSGRLEEIDGINALATDGRADHGEVPNASPLAPGDESFTLEMWVKTDSRAHGWNLPLEWVGGDRIYVGQDVGDGWNFVVTTDGVRTDTQDGPGELTEIRTTHRYSDDIGQVLYETTGHEATYEFEGDEIYVRARVISSELHPNPYVEGERKQAWIQPVIPGEGLRQVPSP